MEEQKSKISLKIIIFIVSAIVILLIAGYFFLFASKTTPAQLHVESGNVLVNEKQVQGNIKLKQNDIIETKENSLATVILYESIIVNLNPGTKITIEELIKNHPQLSQESGETWSTFTSLLGIEEYSIKEGNAVASVRATFFGLKKEYIITGEGKVSYKINEKEFLVNKNKVVEIISNEAAERDATQEELEKIRQARERAVKELKYLRERELEKNPLLIRIIKTQTKMNEQELRAYLEDIDNEKIDIDELAKQSPFKTASISKIIEITKFIQKLKREV